VVASRARPRAVADGATRGAPSARSVNEHRIADGRAEGPRPWATYTCGPEIADRATHRVAICGQPQARPIAHMLPKPPLSTVATRCGARTGPLGDPLLSGSHAAYHDREAATRGRSHRWPHSAWRRVRRLAHSRSPARDAACGIAAARRPKRSRVRAFLLRQAAAIECGRPSGGHHGHP